MSAKNRPLVVSIVGWYLIVACICTLLVAPFAFRNPLTQEMVRASGASLGVLLLISVVGAIVYCAAGVAMLKGKRWGRQLYLVVTPLAGAVTVILYGMDWLWIALMGWVAYGVLFVLLTRHRVNEFFSGEVASPVLPVDTPLQPDVPKRATWKRVVSIVLLIPGGFFLMSWFMVVGSLSGEMKGLVIFSGVWLMLTCAFIVPAIFLWGRKQWAGVLGILLSAIGGMLLMSAVAFHQMAHMKIFRGQMAAPDPVLMEQLGHDSIIFGIASSILGILLILLHRRKRKDAASVALASPT